MNAYATLKRIAFPAAGLLLAIFAATEARHLRAAGDQAATGSESPGNRSGGAAAAARAEAAGAGRVSAEGRLVTYPGGEVVVGTDLAGTVVRLGVAEKDRVRRGEPIAELRADDLRAELAEARAKVVEAEAEIRWADVDAQRARNLLAAEVGTQAALDRSQTSCDAAHARRATALAEVERLGAVLAKTRIVAPIDGTVTVRAVQPGEHVAAGAPLVTVANLARTRVEAEVDEFDSGRVALGAPVEVTAEGYDGRTFRGRVEEIPDAVVARRLKPQDPGRPADTRVLLVKIALLEPAPFKLGQRVEISIAPRAAAGRDVTPGPAHAYLRRRANGRPGKE